MPNQSNGKPPLEIVYIRPPLHTLDLVLLPKLPGKNIIANHMVDKVINVHEEVKKKLEESTTKYKAYKNKHRHFKFFAVGDQVMVNLQKDRFRFGEYNKLKQNKIESFLVLKKINDNACVMDLWVNYNISKTFNIQDLLEYHGRSPLPYD